MINAINSIDKRSLRKVESEIIVSKDIVQIQVWRRGNYDSFKPFQMQLHVRGILSVKYLFGEAKIA